MVWTEAQGLGAGTQVYLIVGALGVQRRERSLAVRAGFQKGESC